MNANFAIDVRNLTKRFGENTVVNRISLQVKTGEICGFLGPNGSGKTTFIRMLCGLLRADEGEGTCLGHDLTKDSDALKREVGYMTQRFSFYEDLSIVENLNFVAQMYSLPNQEFVVAEALDRLGLSHRKQQLAGELSGGWKQRLALAACLIHKPKLLLLDEPTAGVDPKARREFWDQIHDLAADGLTFLIATHYMDEAQRCHRLAYILRGNLLAFGTANQVINNAHLTTWSVSGPDLTSLAKELNQLASVEQVAAFGTTLHVSGVNESQLKEDLSPYWRSPYTWKQVDTDLEDVFIHLMQDAKEQ